MSSMLLLVLVAIIGGIASVGFAALTGTGILGLYGASGVTILLGLALAHWNDKRIERQIASGSSRIRE